MKITALCLVVFFQWILILAEAKQQKSGKDDLVFEVLISWEGHKIKLKVPYSFAVKSN